MKHVILNNGNIVKISYSQINGIAVNALQNVICENDKGELQWQINTQGAHFASMPNKDAFVGLIYKKNGDLFGATFSGFRYKIDQLTGLAVCVGLYK